MHLQNTRLTLSATDLANFLGCRHRTALDMAAAHGERQRPYYDDPLLDALRERGLQHERRYVDSLRAAGKRVADLNHAGSPDERITLTEVAMINGVDVIVQGALRDDRWFGKPDVLLRVDAPSAFGAWSYEIADTKLARETKAGTILQLGLYSELLLQAQGVRPERFHVVTPDATAPVQTYRVADYAAYFRLVRAQMLATVASDYDAIAARYYPEPVDHCDVCDWIAECIAKRHADDHLSLVAGITRMQRHELESRAVTTVVDLAALPLPIQPKPKRGSIETYVRVREQARIQVASRGRTPPLHELLDVEAERGLSRLPEPTPGDLFLDLEGDPLAGESGREYLFGVATAEGDYRAAWAMTEHDERCGFEWVMDTIADAIARHPGMHVYHYAPYEPSAFKRLMGRYATRERELDAMLRAGRFVDLYGVVRQGLRAGVERYSIKNLEPLYGFARAVPLADANRGLRAMEYALQMGIPDSVTAEARSTVEGYNRDDCISTLRLRDWLEELRRGLVATGADVPRPTLQDGAAPDEIDERARRVEELRVRLLAGVPDTLSERDSEQQGRWLLAYLLDYHRREDRATWWEYFRLCELPEDELEEEREAVVRLQFVARVEEVRGKNGRLTGSVVDCYSYPEQEMEIDPGDEVWLQDRRRYGAVQAVNRAERTLDIKKGPKIAAVHPNAIFAFTHVSSEAMEGALARIGECFASGASAYGAARSLLNREAPRLRSGAFEPIGGESATDFALRIVHDLDDTVLPIQGPPGAGKTWCGAELICALVKAGRRVGVTANSHEVIRHLLEKVGERAAERGIAIRLGHKCDDDPEVGGVVEPFSDNGTARQVLASGAVNVLGGTAWMWSREEFASSVDVLFVDEAGQMCLANAVAVSQAAGSVVLLGDPRQLEQPRKGSHPDGVNVSALEHLLGGRQTIPPDRGIFLGETWRLAPAICDFTSELFYEGRLTSRAGLENQRLIGIDGVPAAGLAFVPVEHEANRNHSDEEVDVIARLVERLTRPGAAWTDHRGEPQPVGGRDIVIVAPYNAQVTRLAECVGASGARVGTVDKFQGQEAPVVIYSMATSRPEDAPRGMEFLYSLNRLNVATSRARCLAVVVASPRLFEPDCQSPRQMQLANGLCRFRELAVEVRTHEFIAASPSAASRS